MNIGMVRTAAICATLVVIAGGCGGGGGGGGSVGTVTEFAIPTANSQPTGITSGPDGNLWFTEAAGKIAKCTTAGLITEFTVPTANSGPSEIVSGSDGNLWFAEGGAGAPGVKVGRCTTSGTITEFMAPGTGIFGIAAGPDGDPLGHRVLYRGGRQGPRDGAPPPGCGPR